MSDSEYSQFRNVSAAEPTDFGSAFFEEVGYNLAKAFNYSKANWGFTDLDALTERNGFPLLIERKDGPIDLYQKGLMAQKKAIEGITRRMPGAFGAIVWGDKGLDTVTACRACYFGVWGPVVEEHARDWLMERIIAWGWWVGEQEKLKKWDTKWKVST